MNDKKVFQSEELIYNVTEDLLILMEEKGISKNDLARALDKSKAYVSQVLSGTRNMTLNTLSDICFALEVKPEINIPIGDARNLLEEEEFIGSPIKRAEKVIKLKEETKWENRRRQQQTNHSVKNSFVIGNQDNAYGWRVAV